MPVELLLYLCLKKEKHADTSKISITVLDSDEGLSRHWVIACSSIDEKYIKDLVANQWQGLLLFNER